MKPSQDPQIKTQLCSKQTCGNTVWSINFVLPTAAATSGWIVQEITYDLNITSPAGTPRRQGHFWEAFYVRANTTGGAYAPAYDDNYGDSNHPNNSTGKTTVIGKAKFYEGTLPAEFIRYNPETFALARRSTKIPPKFWDGSGTDHSLTVTWDCTAGRDVTNMQPTPDEGFCG
jgi:hypothetical protein